MVYARQISRYERNQNTALGTRLQPVTAAARSDISSRRSGFSIDFSGTGSVAVSLRRVLCCLCVAGYFKKLK